MIKEFLIRAWKPYLVSVSVYSLFMTTIFSLLYGALSLYFVLSFGLGMIMMAIPLVFILGMPMACYIWIIIQRREYKINSLQALLLGGIIGMALNTLYILPIIGATELRQIMLYSSITGGGYGAFFSFLFARSGGFRLN